MILENLNIYNLLSIIGLVLVCILVILNIVKLIMSSHKIKDTYIKGIIFGHIEMYDSNIKSNIKDIEKSIDKEKDSDITFILNRINKITDIINQLDLSKKLDLYKFAEEQMVALDKIVSVMVYKHTDPISINEKKRKKIINGIADNTGKDNHSLNNVLSTIKDISQELNKDTEKFNRDFGDDSSDESISGSIL